jgi:hypothetical protein
MTIINHNSIPRLRMCTINNIPNIIYNALLLRPRHFHLIRPMEEHHRRPNNRHHLRRCRIPRNNISNNLIIITRLILL